MASASRRLYIGVTGQLARRVHQHQIGEFKGFSKKYQMKRLVYAEATVDVRAAINLIESLNPDWRDLADDWG